MENPFNYLQFATGAYRRRFRLGPSSTVSSVKRKLIEDGHIDQYELECRIADPFFAEFLRSV